MFFLFAYFLGKTRDNVLIEVSVLAARYVLFCQQPSPQTAFSIVGKLLITLNLCSGRRQEPEGNQRPDREWRDRGYVPLSGFAFYNGRLLMIAVPDS